jgi:hypothetical protein
MSSAEDDIEPLCRAVITLIQMRTAAVNQSTIDGARYSHLTSGVDHIWEMENSSQCSRASIFFGNYVSKIGNRNDSFDVGPKE